MAPEFAGEVGLGLAAPDLSARNVELGEKREEELAAPEGVSSVPGIEQTFESHRSLLGRLVDLLALDKQPFALLPVVVSGNVAPFKPLTYALELGVDACRCIR